MTYWDLDTGKKEPCLNMTSSSWSFFQAPGSRYLFGMMRDSELVEGVEYNTIRTFVVKKKMKCKIVLKVD